MAIINKNRLAILRLLNNKPNNINQISKKISLCYSSTHEFFESLFNEGLIEKDGNVVRLTKAGKAFLRALDAGTEIAKG
jgi:predicted transcriptional regulator